MNQTLTRKQFDILSILAEEKGTLSQRQLGEKSGHSLGTVNRVMQELTELQYVTEGEITGAGISALEPYRAKRAIFIAAGFGSRLVPITFNTPKPLVRVHGQRIIDGLIDACLDAGINEIYIVRGYLADTVYSRYYRVLLVGALIALPLFLLLVTLGGYKIIKRSFAPVRAISEAARAIGETGDLSQRIPLDDSRDEIHQMGRTFNWMLGQLEELLEREKRFTSDVSHELRTPTAVIMAESEFGKDYTDNLEEAREEFQHIFQQSRRMSQLINQLLELSRLGNRKNLELVPVDLSKLIRETLEDYQKLPQSGKFQWEERIESGLQVLGDEPLLHRILSNYLDNALKFARSRIAVSLKKTQEGICLAVEDDGNGIPPGELDKIWNRLYQADPSRNKKQNMGLGLGLSFVAAAAKLMKGKVRAESQMGKGSTFFLWLPPQER